MLVIISTCRMGASNLKLILISFTWNCTTCHNFFSMLKKNLFYASWKMAHGYADIAMRRYRAGPLNILIFKKLAGLWWAGKVVNHIWIYGSKVAEGSSAFQRRSCILWWCFHTCDCEYMLFQKRYFECVSVSLSFVKEISTINLWRNETLNTSFYSAPYKDIICTLILGEHQVNCNMSLVHYGTCMQ